VEGVVINGEFGARHSEYTLEAARRALVEHQVATCEAHMSGWLYWTWDSDEDATQRLFHRANESGGAIAWELSPTRRPDPCKLRQAVGPQPGPRPSGSPQPPEGQG
jgi:hypothetical protein